VWGGFAIATGVTVFCGKSDGKQEATVSTSRLNLVHASADEFARFNLVLFLSFLERTCASNFGFTNFKFFHFFLPY